MREPVLEDDDKGELEVLRGTLKVLRILNVKRFLRAR